MISSRASRTATSNADVAFVITEGGHVRRVKIEFLEIDRTSKEWTAVGSLQGPPIFQGHS